MTNSFETYIKTLDWSYFFTNFTSVEPDHQNASWVFYYNGLKRKVGYWETTKMICQLEDIQLEQNKRRT